MPSDDTYLNALRIDSEIAKDYYQKSLAEKPEQVKYLEQLLAEETLVPESIADICCGTGALAVHLARLYPTATFSLVDLNPTAVDLARENVRHLSARCQIGSVYEPPLPANSHDLVLCWQSLLDLDQPQAALLSLVKLCKPNGKIVVCSLFNFDFDVDIFAQVVDHTRPSAQEGLSLAYNTLSISTVRRWMLGHVSELRAYPFKIEIDLPRKARGLGTFTIRTEDGGRLQVSAGMLMNWGIVIMTK